MKLHRTTGRPDWVDITPARRNLWQRWAATTGGTATPGNLLTILGFVLVVIGSVVLLDHRYWPALILLAIGRGLDIADGWVADATGTKSPLGELLDAGLDKLGTFLTLAAFFAVGIASRWLLVAILVPQVVIAIATPILRRRHRALHPSQLGKLSMAAAWISLLGFALVRAANSMLTWPVDVLAGLSVVLGGVAAWNYLRGRD